MRCSHSLEPMLAIALLETRLSRLLVPQRGVEGPLTPELGGACAHLTAGNGHAACCEAWAESVI